MNMDINPQTLLGVLVRSVRNKSLVNFIEKEPAGTLVPKEWNSELQR